MKYVFYYCSNIYIYLLIYLMHLVSAVLKVAFDLCTLIDFKLVITSYVGLTLNYSMRRK